MSCKHFEKHLQFIEPQKRYFQYLKEETELSIAFVRSESLTAIQNKITSLINAIEVQERNDLLIFDKIIDKSIAADILFEDDKVSSERAVQKV